MLICPHCKSENLDNYKFCQNCGTPLTETICRECGTNVPVNTENCQNCGAKSGKIWWATVKKQAAVTEADGKPMESGSYLDHQQRYQLLESLPAISSIAIEAEVSVKVLDCQPYKKSFLEVMLANQGKVDLSASVGISEIPYLAKPYIALRTQSNQGIPLIHDAWQNSDVQVLLIEDRSNWRYLLDDWREETTDSFQIIHTFYRMTQLWTTLETVNCRQSLLDLSNLRLDEDQSLALQRLYVEKLEAKQEEEGIAGEPLSIKDLGRVWHSLFRESQRTQFGSLPQLLEDLENGKIPTVVELQLSLEAIATQLQPNVNASAPVGNQVPTTSARTILQLDDIEDTITRSDDMPTQALPMQLVSLEDAGLTDVGRQRDHNEDYFGVETKINKLELSKSREITARGLYVLCDGMGGHAGGEVASELAVTTLRQYFHEHWTGKELPDENCIRQAIRLANQKIYDLNQQDARSGIGRMGTTLVTVLIQDNKVAVAHVGDSRLYRLTKRQGLEQITVDHEVGQREISRGVEPSVAYSRPDAYQLTQALGPRDENFVVPDVQFLDISEDMLLLLASDGLSDNDLLEQYWETHLKPLLSSAASLEGGVKSLIDLANQYNGHDNITAIVIRAKVAPKFLSIFSVS